MFAREVKTQCYEKQYISSINDGGLELGKLVSQGAVHLGFGNKMGKKDREHSVSTIW